MLKDMYCEKCQIKLDKAEAANLRWHIKFGYRNNWIIDNLPSASLMTIWSGEKRRRYSGGFPIGFMDPEKKQPYLYNHVNIYIDYYALGDDGYRVIGFAVEPLSVHHKFEGDYDWDGESVEGMNKTLNTCPSIGLLRSNSIREFQVVKAGQKILFTYGVTFIPSEVEWTSRWDVYLSEDHLVPDQVHSYSISNSVIFVLCLTLFLIRNLRREIAAHNALATLAAEEQNKDSMYRLFAHMQFTWIA
jgi:transmembrane 9 superfamily protein 2/4